MGQKQVFQTGLTDVYINSTVWYETPGTIRYENNAIYKFVAFSGATAVAAGDFLSYVAYASDGNAYICDKANTALPAGVAMAAVASGSKATGAVAYGQGWVQIAGLATLANALNGGPALGQPLTNQGQSAGVVGALSTTIATTVTQTVIGSCYDATAKVVLLSCFN